VAAEVATTEVGTAEVGATAAAEVGATAAAEVAATEAAAEVGATTAATKPGGSRHARYDDCQEENCCGTNSSVHDGDSRHALNTTFQSKPSLLPITVCRQMQIKKIFMPKILQGKLASWH
jgi:hypothetical protein